MEYDQAVAHLTDIISGRKELKHKDSVMMISIEGLSNSGKTTLSVVLERELNILGYSAWALEGDLYYIGRDKALEIYSEFIENYRDGKPIPVDYFKHTWRYDLLKGQVIDKVCEFNISKDETLGVKLEDVLEDKRDGSEHRRKHIIDRKTIILVPSLFLSHLNQFDYSIELQIKPETSYKRKIERDEKKGSTQDPKISKDIIMLLEYPEMVRFRHENENKPDITLNTNNFSNVRIV